jgi:hypothetical protein
MEQRPSWGANYQSSDVEVSHISWNADVLYGVHKSPALDHILSQINPVHAPTEFLFKIPFNTILSSTSRFLSSSLFPSSFSVKVKNLYCIHCFEKLLLLYDDKIKEVPSDRYAVLGRQ